MEVLNCGITGVEKERKYQNCETEVKFLARKFTFWPFTIMCSGLRTCIWYQFDHGSEMWWQQKYKHWKSFCCPYHEGK